MVRKVVGALIVALALMFPVSAFAPMHHVSASGVTAPNIIGGCRNCEE